MRLSERHLALEDSTEEVRALQTSTKTGKRKNKPKASKPNLQKQNRKGKKNQNVQLTSTLKQVNQGDECV